MRVSLRQNAPGLAKKAYPPRSGTGKPTKKDFYGWLPGYVTYLQTTHKSLVTVGSVGTEVVDNISKLLPFELFRIHYEFLLSLSSFCGNVKGF